MLELGTPNRWTGWCFRHLGRAGQRAKALGDDGKADDDRAEHEEVAAPEMVCLGQQERPDRYDHTHAEDGQASPNFTPCS